MGQKSAREKGFRFQMIHMKERTSCYSHLGLHSTMCNVSKHWSHFLCLCDFFFLPFLKFHITWHYNTRTRAHRCPVFHRSGGKQALHNEFMAGWWCLLVENTLFICESKGELKQFGYLLTSQPHILRTRFSCWSAIFPSTAFKLSLERCYSVRLYIYT